MRVLVLVHAWSRPAFANRQQQQQPQQQRRLLLFAAEVLWDRGHQ
jgi:hypothetical protein